MELTDEAREVAERFMRLPAHLRPAVLELLRALTEPPKGVSGKEFVEAIMSIPAEVREEWAQALEEYLEEERKRYEALTGYQRVGSGTARSGDS
ncbi:MAG: hypothetical protein NZM28_10015 [Fimbriimonadales bacterium]|nr:hypothetical protein [Fimbriimonadales bacterium]